MVLQVEKGHNLNFWFYFFPRDLRNIWEIHTNYFDENEVPHAFRKWHFPLKLPSLLFPYQNKKKSTESGPKMCSGLRFAVMKNLRICVLVYIPSHSPYPSTKCVNSQATTTFPSYLLSLCLFYTTLLLLVHNLIQIGTNIMKLRSICEIDGTYRIAVIKYCAMYIHKIPNSDDEIYGERKERREGDVNEK